MNIADDIQVLGLLPFSHMQCRLIRVTNNAWDMTPNLDLAGMNLLIAIICALQRQVSKRTDLDFGSYRETKVAIPRKYISLHNSTEFEEGLRYLYEFSFVFNRSIPGYKSVGITRLISGIGYEAGNVIVTIPGDTIPWLIYMGPGVNFLQLEEKVFFRLKTLPHKRLYLFLMSRTDFTLRRSYITVPIEELYRVLNLEGRNVTISTVLQKILTPFCNCMKDENVGSNFSVTCELKRKDGFTGQRGRKPVDRIEFVVENRRSGEQQLADPVTVLAERLVKLWSGYGPKKTISIVWLIEQIEKTGCENEILAKMDYQSRKNEKDVNYDRLANTTIKILRDDYNIVII